ncbi:FHIPEP family type III secretion protein, partial [Herbaspirillum sp. RTI4]
HEKLSGLERRRKFLITRCSDRLNPPLLFCGGITKGSERVAEVAARFSLDGMPGKQMSIDADQRAGVLDTEGARERRHSLERESQLYGSYDGAMKFIKGDAIAGIVIIFVNFIGGISVGVLQQGMSFSDALQIYTLLTIGDGLVAQIPALLISISAGFIVTRVSGSGKNLGQSIVHEMFANTFVLGTTALVVLAMGLLPGFPIGVFTVLGISLGSFCYYKEKKSRKIPESGNADHGVVGSYDEHREVGFNTDSMMAETVPLICILPSCHQALWNTQQVEEKYRQRFFMEFGFRMPQLVTRFSDTLDPEIVRIMINEVPAGDCSILFGSSQLVNPSDELLSMDLQIKQITDNTGKTSCWVVADDITRIEQLGYQLRSDIDELFCNISSLILRNVTEFFGIQETKNLLDELEKKYPELLKETYRYAPVQRISEVFQRLLHEQISIRNMKLILEALAQWGGREKDVIALVEHARNALARYISNKFSVDGTLRVAVISPRIEEVVRGGIRQSQGASYLNLEPEQKDEIIDLLSVSLEGLHISLKDMVLLTSVDVRRFFKKLIEDRFPDLQVLSFGEVSDSISVDILKTI